MITEKYIYNSLKKILKEYLKRLFYFEEKAFDYRIDRGIGLKIMYSYNSKLNKYIYNQKDPVFLKYLDFFDKYNLFKIRRKEIIKIRSRVLIILILLNVIIGFKLKNKMSEEIKNEKILISYVRSCKDELDKDGKVIKRGYPIGVVVSTGSGVVGWSLCNTRDGDVFNKQRGIDLAKARCLLIKDMKKVVGFDLPDFYLKNVPRTVIEEHGEMMIRSFAYFKDEE